MTSKNRVLGLVMRQREKVPCTVEINHTFEELGAHVRFHNGIVVHPGDEVMVHGSPVEVPYGERHSFERDATITRASGVERLWTKATGDLEFMELCEFSFTESVTL
jgi:hypothetical protein